MKNSEIKKDKRLDHIQEQLIKFTQFNFNGRIPLSDKGDEIDAIILGLNTLAEELSVKQKK
jgi:hypothetical protein